MAGAAITYSIIIITTMTAIMITTIILALVMDMPNRRAGINQMFTSIITTTWAAVQEVAEARVEAVDAEEGADNEKIPSPYFCRHDPDLQQSSRTNHRHSLSF